MTVYVSGVKSSTDFIKELFFCISLNLHNFTLQCLSFSSNSSLSFAYNTSLENSVLNRIIITTWYRTTCLFGDTLH